MDPINDINIPNITTQGGAIRLIQNAQINLRTNEALRKPIEIDDTRIWMQTAPESIPIQVPVTTIVGTPVIDMPGCVAISKENNTKFEGNKNKQLVNDDPKGNVVACDAGMPYYQPPDYQANELTWMTVYGEPEEQEQGLNTEDTSVIPDSPETPPTDQPEGEVPCPGPNAPRIGDVAQNKEEKVSGFELQQDPNNPQREICVTLYEPITRVEALLPDVSTVTTTATIAVVATSSALLAKPLADLLMRVVKPLVKKVMTKANAILGKTSYRPTRQEVLTDQYRLKKGLLPTKKGKKKKPLTKGKKKKFLLF